MLNPGLNQRPLDFSLKCLLHHFPLCVPPPLSSSSLSLALLFSLYLSLCASSFVSLPPSFLLLLLAEKKSPEKKNESVFIYVTLPIIHFLSLLKFWSGASSLFSFNGMKVDYWNGGAYFSFLFFVSDHWPARQTQTNPLLSRAAVSPTFMSTTSSCHYFWYCCDFMINKILHFSSLLFFSF